MSEQRSPVDLLNDLSWGDGSNNQAMRGFIEASLQQTAREWQRGASPRANREKAAKRAALDFLARNLGLWKEENNHWVLHDSLAQICEAIFLEALTPVDTPISLFPPNAYGWITTPFRFLGGQEVGVWVSSDGFLTDRGQTRESVLGGHGECSFVENWIRRTGDEAAHVVNGVFYINGEFRIIMSLDRDQDVLRIVNAMLLFYGIAMGVCRSQKEEWRDIS